VQSKLITFIREHACVGDEHADETFRMDRYRLCLNMLIKAWATDYPDCIIMMKGNGVDQADERLWINPPRASFLTELIVPITDHQESRIGEFNETMFYDHSDDLVIQFALKARRLTENFYDWRKIWLERITKMEDNDAQELI